MPVGNRDVMSGSTRRSGNPVRLRFIGWFWRSGQTKCRVLLPSTGLLACRPSSDRSHLLPQMATSTGSVIGFRSKGADILGISSQTSSKMRPAGIALRIPKWIHARPFCRRGRTIISGGNQTWVSRGGRRTEELDFYMDWSGYTTGYTTSAEYPSNRAHSRAGPPVE